MFEWQILGLVASGALALVGWKSDHDDAAKAREAQQPPQAAGPVVAGSQPSKAPQSLPEKAETSATIAGDNGMPSEDATSQERPRHPVEQTVDKPQPPQPAAAPVPSVSKSPLTQSVTAPLPPTGMAQALLAHVQRDNPDLAGDMLNRIRDSDERAVPEMTKLKPRIVAKEDDVYELVLDGLEEDLHHVCDGLRQHGRFCAVRRHG